MRISADGLFHRRQEQALLTGPVVRQNAPYRRRIRTVFLEVSRADVLRKEAAGVGIGNWERLVWGKYFSEKLVVFLFWVS